MAKAIGAKYAECSAKTGEGVRELFAGALRESMKGRVLEKMKRRVCKFI